MCEGLYFASADGLDLLGDEVAGEGVSFLLSEELVVLPDGVELLRA